MNNDRIDRESPIGVFDSGIGGLTVAREIMRQIPNEKIVYFGDTARVPYGNKSKETVTRFSRQIVRFSGNASCENHRGGMQYGECLCIG